MKDGGRGGIRTRGRLSPSMVFKTIALNRSATLPLDLRQRLPNGRRIGAGFVLLFSNDLVLQGFDRQQAYVFKTCPLSRSAISPSRSRIAQGNSIRRACV